MNKTEKLWVAITAYNPLNRVKSLFKILNLYTQYELDVHVSLYVNYEAQDDLDKLSALLRPFKGSLSIDLVVADECYEGWGLTWAHKNDLVLNCMNYRYDYYIYQEDDIFINWDNFKYWVRWRPRLAAHGLEPGFLRCEDFEDKKIPIDNHNKFYLTKRTPNVWSERGFDVTKTLVVDHEIEFFAQVASPYYAAMILTNEDAIKYVKSDSMHMVKSAEIVSFRNWPLPDRSSMGLAFEDVPHGSEHRRAIPVIESKGRYIPHECCLITHNDTKYSIALKERVADLISCDKMFEI